MRKAKTLAQLIAEIPELSRMMKCTLERHGISYRELWDDWASPVFDGSGCIVVNPHPRKGFITCDVPPHPEAYRKMADLFMDLAKQMEVEE